MTVGQAMRPAVPVGVAALAISLLLGLQPLTTDLYLPALPMIATAFDAPLSLLQLTMSATVLAFGGGQLAWGPVADRVGRRPVLLAGLTVYLLANLVAAAAPSIGWLVLMRALQGLALAAMVVCGRAMVRDLYEPQQGAHVMARALTGLGLIALAAPTVGGLVAAHWGWRFAFVTIALVAALTLAFVALRLPETQPHRNLHALRPGPLWRAWQAMLGSRTFTGYAGLSACSFTGVVIYLVGSSIVMMRQLGLGPLAYGFTLMAASGIYVTGTITCRRWLPRFGLAGTARRGALFAATGGVSMLVLATAGVQGVWALLLPQLVYSFGHGLSQPCSQAGSVAAFPREAGTAASLAGSIMALLSFVGTWWLGHTLTTNAWPVALGSAVSACCAALIAFAVLPADRITLATNSPTPATR